MAGQAESTMVPDARATLVPEARTAPDPGVPRATDGDIALLGGLVRPGTHVLATVPWPGSRDRRLWAVVVGPSGVWLIEQRRWRGVGVRDGRVFRARQEMTGTLHDLSALAGRLTVDLMRIGLVPGEVHAVVALAGRGGRAGRSEDGVEVIGERELASFVAGPGRRLSPSAVESVLARVRDVLGPAAPELAGVGVAAPAAEPAQPPDAVHPPWATMLDPAQAAAAWRVWPGPLRVRGLPGSGTSTVAVHRAVHLARTWDGRIAVVVPTAPLAGELRDRIALVGQDVVDRIVVERPVDLARRVLGEQGRALRDDPAAFAAAWSSAELAAGVLTSGADGLAGDGRLRAEVMRVIRGRGLTEQADYDALRPELPGALRHQVWALAEAFARELTLRDLPDEHDALRIATAALTTGAIHDPGFAAVVVDDAQDLTLGALRFVAALAGDGEDSLTVLDDGLPGVHPAGVSLPEAGIDVGDRLVTLEVSRRLSARTWAYAVDLVSSDIAPDLGGLAARPGVRAGLRAGAEPVYVRSAIARLRRAKLVALAGELLAGGCPGGLAVLCLGREPEPDLLADLALAGLVVGDLADPAPDVVHLGRAVDARGLEFDHVLVADAPHRMFVDDQRDAWDRVLLRRSLALAVTRSRTGVWIGGV